MAVQSVMPNLYSADVDRAVAFYRDLLGGTQTFRHPAKGPAEHVELRLGDITIAISSKQAVEAEGMPAPAGVRRRPRRQLDRGGEQGEIAGPALSCGGSARGTRWPG